MAVRPVDWMADIMEEGGAVLDMVTSFWGREKDMLFMLGRLERADRMDFVQLSQCMGTEKVAV